MLCRRTSPEQRSEARESPPGIRGRGEERDEEEEHSAECHDRRRDANDDRGGVTLQQGRASSEATSDEEEERWVQVGLGAVRAKGDDRDGPRSEGGDEYPDRQGAPAP